MSNDPLQDFVHKALTGQPDRRAPRTLIDRVNTVIAMREALPWHARGWTAWPAPARVLVVATSLAAVAVFVWLGFAVAEWFSDAPVREIAAEKAPMVSALSTALFTVLEGLRLAIERIAQPYLLGLLVVMGGAYAACIGVGATLYRSFQAHRG